MTKVSSLHHHCYWTKWWVWSLVLCGAYYCYYGDYYYDEFLVLSASDSCRGEPRCDADRWSEECCHDATIVCPFRESRLWDQWQTQSSCTRAQTQKLWWMHRRQSCHKIKVELQLAQRPFQGKSNGELAALIHLCPTLFWERKKALKYFCLNSSKQTLVLAQRWKYPQRKLKIVRAHVVSRFFNQHSPLQATWLERRNHETSPRTLSPVLARHVNSTVLELYLQLELPIAALKK